MVRWPIKVKQKVLLCNSTLRNGAAAMAVVSNNFPQGPALAAALTDTLFRFILTVVTASMFGKFITKES